MPRLPDTYAPLPTPQPARGIAGYQGGAAAQAAVRMGETLGQIGENYQRENDAQAIFEARRKLDDWERAAIYDPEKGAVSKLGRDAFGLPQQIPEAFDSAANDIAKGLSTDRQRKVFNELALSRREQAASWADRHALHQRTVFNEQQYQADLTAAVERAATVAVVDPSKIDAEIAVMQTRIVGRGKELSKPEQMVANEVKAQTSKIHLAAVTAMLESDKPLVAQTYLKDRGAGLAFDDWAKAQHMVNQQVDNVVAFNKANNAMQRVVPRIAPTEGERLANVFGAPGPSNKDEIVAILTPLIRKQESNGRQFDKNGKLLEGPMTKYGTAKGDMQVLDSTAKSPGLGVRPVQDDSPEERSRVGRDYVKALVDRYDGDYAKAAAAYNWGMGNVDQAILRANARPGGEWLAFAPAETRNYVANVVKGFETGGGRPPMPTLQEVHANLRNDPELAANPRRLKIALDQVTAQFNDAMKAKKESEDAAVAEALRQVYANGGKFSLLPANVRRAIPPEKVDDVMNAAQKYAKGDDVDNPATYLKLTDPAYLKSLSPQEFYNLRPYLKESSWQHFAQQKNHLEKPDKPKDPGDLDAAALNAALNPRLKSINVDPTPKDSDSTGVQRAGAIQKYVRESVLAAQQAQGKKLNDAEIERHIDGLFIKDQAFKGWLYGTNTKKVLSTKYSDLPGDVVKTLKADLARRGNTSPSEGEILAAYFEAANSRPRDTTGRF